MLRKEFHPEYYGEMETQSPSMGVVDPNDFDHVGHCIDSLRESIMCSADITPIVWIWDEERKRSTPRLDVVHTCRNFEKLQDWGKAHKLRKYFNDKVHVVRD
jgi:Mycotoxin biosynthesis protein UstYa